MQERTGLKTRHYKDCSDERFTRLGAWASYFVLRVRWKTMGVSLPSSRQVHVSVM